MNRTLEIACDEATDLPEDVQERLGKHLLHEIRSWRANNPKSGSSGAGGFITRLDTDPAFEASVAAALEEGERDIEAGRVQPLEDAIADIEAMIESGDAKI